jgi:nucleotide-binding universal stress UspA family protein
VPGLALATLRAMYHSIVVGTDGSASAGQAVTRAVELARSGPDPASLHLVSAYQPLTSEQVAYLQGAMPEAYRHAVGSDMAPRTALTDAAELAGTAGIAYTTHDPHGTPTEAILAVAEEVGADLIVVGSRGLGATRRLVLGSVSSSLAHEAPIDVLIVRTAVGNDGGAETVTSAIGRLGEAASRFESDHPDLVRTISDVSYYLSGLGI